MTSPFRTRALLAAFALATMLGATASPAAAQSTGTVRGRVLEAKTLRPLAGAQVVVVGTGKGTLTTAAGDFAILEVPAGRFTIRAEMIGYTVAEREVTVVAGQVAQVGLELAQTVIAMDEIVVTGTAGAVSKRTLGNSITKLDVAEVLEKTTPSSLTELLQAKSPGIQILPNSGTPGAAADIRIRGASSFINNKPVVFVDGVRYNTDDLGNFAPSGAGTTGYSAQVTSALDFINPNDIESIEVIKGPAAATLYGAEAANGVIQIITKKGARGDQRVQWDIKFDQGQNEWAVDMPANYTTCDATKIAGRDRVGDPTWPGCQGLAENTVITDTPLRRDPRAMRDGAAQKIALSARGGGSNYSFFLSGDHTENQGIFHNSHSDRSSVRANFVLNPTDKMDVSINTSYARGDLRLPVGDEAAQGPLLSAFRGKPGLRTRNEENMGWATTRPDQYNSYNNATRSDRLTLGTTVNVIPVRWFRNRVTLGFDYTSSLAQLLSPPGSTDADYAGVPQGVVAQRVPRNYLYTIDYAGNIDRDLTADISSTTSFGMQATSRRYETLVAVGTGFGAPDVTLIGTAQTTVGYNSFVEAKSVGFFAQEQVGWKNRLFVTGAVRADDNSAFGEAFDWIYYPKASLSWVLSEEPMVSSALESARVNSFKFRAAYGHAGRAPDPFSASQTYTVDKAVVDGQIVSALRPRAYGNPNLAAERGVEYEIGFDAGLFQDRLGVDFTYYNKRLQDVIIPVGVPGSTGFGGTFYGGTSSKLQNMGETLNRGFEVGLNGTVLQTSKLVWNSRLTLATNHNELLFFGDERTKITPFAPYGSVQQHRAGYPLAGYWAQLPLRNDDGTPVLNAKGVVQLDSAVYIGPSAPTREIGFSNTFTVMRDFRVFVLLDYKGGHHLFNYKEYNRCRFNSNCERVNDPKLQDDPEMPVWKQSVPGVYIEKADFIKLRDVSVSYSLPSELARRFRGNAASIMLSAHNLAQWTDYSGIDPETNSYGNRDFVRADVYALPMMRRMSMSLNVSF